MIAQNIMIDRMIEAAKAAQELGANLTLEPDGVAVRATLGVILVPYQQVEHGSENELLRMVEKATG